MTVSYIQEQATPLIIFHGRSGWHIIDQHLRYTKATNLSSSFKNSHTHTHTHDSSRKTRLQNPRYGPINGLFAIIRVTMNDILKHKKIINLAIQSYVFMPYLNLKYMNICNCYNKISDMMAILSSFESIGFKFQPR